MTSITDLRRADKVLAASEDENVGDNMQTHS